MFVSQFMTVFLSLSDIRYIFRGGDSHSNLKCHVNVWSAQALHLFAVANGQLIYSNAGLFAISSAMKILHCFLSHMCILANAMQE